MEAHSLPNWIPDTNRYHLPEPPEWFLKRLYDFDAQLVIIPSRMDIIPGAKPKYLLTRRRLYSAGIGDVAMLDNRHPDTNMCYTHGVVPIGPLTFKSNSGVFTEACLGSLLAELRARDTWAITGGHDGNADKLVDQIEQSEEQAEVKRRDALKDMFYHRARDAWRSMQARIGTRNKRASDYHGVARLHNGTAAKVESPS